MLQLISILFLFDQDQPCYAFLNYATNSYYLNPIDLNNFSNNILLDRHQMSPKADHRSSEFHHLHHHNHHQNMPSAIECNGIIQPMPPTAASVTNGSDLDINVIKDCLMTTRVPESCVWPVTEAERSSSWLQYCDAVFYSITIPKDKSSVLSCYISILVDVAEILANLFVPLWKHVEVWNVFFWE